jgi:hypothetical protein
MRTRQQLTVAGAFAVATTAIVGGAFVTSHAMADATPQALGTLTIVATTAGSGDVVKCTYDNVPLPSVTFSAVGTAQFGGSPAAPTGPINVFTGSVPIDADGGPLPGLVATQAEPIGGGVAVATQPGAAGATLTSGVDVVPVGKTAMFDSRDARLGTAEECAALRRHLESREGTP